MRTEATYLVTTDDETRIAGFRCSPHRKFLGRRCLWKVGSSMRGKSWLTHLSILAACQVLGPLCYAIDGSNVLVLYNSGSADGQQIANYYAGLHQGVQLLPINGIGTSDDISADDYLNIVRPQVLSALATSPTVIDDIVTTKGMPLASTSESPSRQRLLGIRCRRMSIPRERAHMILSWNPTSSLESELATVDKVSTWQQMGDQSWQIPGQASSNPYYRSSSSFNQAAMGTRLTSRLDGFTVSDVLASLDKAQHAFVGPLNNPAAPFHFLVDNDPSKTYAPTMANLVNNVLTPAGLPVTYDNTGAFVGTTTGPVIGYDSHGANQASTPAGYISTGLNISLANGAVFNSWESYNAVSFTPGGNHGNQGLIAEWLQKGGTAAVGNVSEPFAGPMYVENEDQMFAMLLSGKTFGEAAWSGMRQLSYVNTVVGDPLMTWKVLLPGDINMDGKVDMADLAVLAAHWGQHVGMNGFGWSSGDLNGDGVIDDSDLALVSSDWGAYRLGAAAPRLPWAPFHPIWDHSWIRCPKNIPEPSSFVMLAIGMALVLVYRWRRAWRAFAIRAAVPSCRPM